LLSLWLFLSAQPLLSALHLMLPSAQLSACCLWLSLSPSLLAPLQQRLQRLA
jgi:hypothetical protein